MSAADRPPDDELVPVTQEDIDQARAEALSDEHLANYLDAPDEDYYRRPEPTRFSGSKAVGVVALWGAVVLGGFMALYVVFQGFMQISLTQGHADLYIGYLILAAGILAAVTLYMLNQEESRWRRSWTGLWVLAGVLAFVGYFATYSNVKNNDKLVEYYCAYGAGSRAQLQECQHNVAASEVEYSQTNAARFARGGECLSDAGPLCRTYFVQREASDAAQNANQP